MTTNNAVTLDDINSFFDLDGQLNDLNIAPTATGGAGINNLQQFPAPRPTIPPWRKVGTDYVKKYLDKEKNEQFLTRRQTLEMPGSTVSIDTLEDVEESSTVVGNAPPVSELRNEATRQIYSTYFREDIIYNPELTITSYREEILQQLDINPVLIIQGPTGCGKTTQVPQYILDHQRSRGTYCNIVVTQPRKIAAMSISQRVCQERKWQLGTIVGYQVAMDQKISSDTCISYVTTGVLLEKLVNAKRMDMYTHIIIDEVHERNQEIDFALLIVKKFLKLNSPRVKIILMSATFDSTAFAKYFCLYEKSGPAPVIDVIGKSKLVNEYYLQEFQSLIQKVPEFDMNNPMIDNCLYDAVLQLMYYFDKIEKAEQNVPTTQSYAPHRGAVLVFLPGYEEISKLSNTLHRNNINIQLNFWIIPLHSSITVEEQTKVFKVPPPDHRKIIISTNIAESSITVPDVKYVIDFCLTKNLVTDTTTNYTCLQLEWASKANCIQRKGRAGRVDIGRVYRMVPLEFYNKFPKYSIPEIKRCPLTRTILQLKKLNLCEPQEMLAFALDPPDLSDIGTAVLHLKEALALTSRSMNPFDGELTFIGRVMSNLPLDIKLSKLIVFGYVFHCLEDCIIIAASLSLQSFFARPFQKTLDAYKSRLAWDDSTFSDCLVYLNAYKMWKQLSQQGQFRRPGGKSESEWANSHFIQVKRIKEVDLLVKEIKSRLEKQHVRGEPHSFRQDEKSVLILKMVIAGAFFPHYFLQEPLDEKTIMRDINENDPHSTVLVSGLPPKHGILYASALKDMFACCSNNIVIEFEEKKAYIKFARNANSSSSNVLRPVYLAVKMRKLGLPLELAVFSPEEAERKCKQILSSKNQSSDHRLVSNRVTVKFDPQMELKRIDVPPPGKSGIIDILITDVINCGSFWARIISPETNNLLRFLEMTIQYDQYKNLKALSKAPVANMLCLAPFVERGKQDYYRAQIKKLKASENIAEVFFVDYGNTEIVKISDLREIDEKTPDVYTTPALALECSLAEVKPFRSPTGEWSDKATEWLKTKVSGIKVQAKIYSVVNNVMRLELHIKDVHGINHFLNKEMIEIGLAEPAEESFTSKQNHEVREKASFYSHTTEPVAGSFSNDVEVSWKSDTMGNVSMTGRSIRLHGPYNPLEVDYSGLTYIDRCKCMKVERESVNSVSFNPDPQEPYSAMLVAASVGVGQSNHDLIARNTTLMPKMRGLPALVCLLFSPYAEIRTNKERSSYIGVLCGLGYDPNTGDSIYPDHDIELPFDIEITMEDLSEINGIRMGVNLLLHSQTDILQYESHQSQNIHHRTRNTILKLLQRQWPSKEPEYTMRPNQWNQIPAHLRLETHVAENADHPDVLPLHKPPSLALPTESLRMLEHLDHLYSIVEGPTSTEFELIRCELCSVDLVSNRDLLVHLDSTAHQKKEKKIRPAVQTDRPLL